MLTNISKVLRIGQKNNLPFLNKQRSLVFPQVAKKLFSHKASKPAREMQIYCIYSPLFGLELNHPDFAA